MPRHVVYPPVYLSLIGNSLRKRQYSPSVIGQHFIEAIFDDIVMRRKIAAISR